MAEYKATAEAVDDVRDSQSGRDLGSRTIRRDPRADPDDDAPAARVDVVTMDRGSSQPGFDSVQNAALSFRREIAKLHQQAAAFERAIDEQRRERSDAFDRIESATARATELERKLDSAERELSEVTRLHDATIAELHRARTEREDLARTVEEASSTRRELEEAREEAAAFRRERDDALESKARFESEVAEIRDRERDGSQRGEAEIHSLREGLESTRTELEQARDERTKTRDEAATLKAEVERLESELGEAKSFEEKAANLTRELKSAKAENAEVRSDFSRLERDLDAARHARDVSIERATNAERATEDLRKDVAKAQRELEGALIASASANTRAITAERAKATIEESFKQLHEEVTAAFTRFQPQSISPAARLSLAPTISGAPGAIAAAALAVTAPPAAMSASPAAISASPAAISDPPAAISVPPATMSSPPVSAEAPFRPAPSAAPSASASPQGFLEAAPVSEAAPNTPRSEAPRKATSFPPPVAEARPLSMRPESIAPTPVLDEDWMMDSPPPVPRMPPPVPSPAPPEVPAARSTPPRASQAPSTPPRASQAPAAEETATAVSVPPPTAAVPKLEDLRPAEPPKTREAVFDMLAEGSRSREAAVELRAHPEWLRGRPPLELLIALSHLDYDLDAPLFEVARSWENEPLSRALVAGLRDEPDPKLREHSAWLLKHLGSPGAWPAFAELVSDDGEPSGVRRWLLEAIERLVTSQALGWRDVGDLVNLVVRNPDPALRDGVIGVVAALERSEDKRRVLLEVLRTDDDENVLSSAVKALTTALPIVLDPAVAERLLGHPSPRVQQSVVDFIERSKRSAKN